MHEYQRIADEKDAEEIILKFLEGDMLSDDAAQEVSTLLENGETMEALRTALRHR